MTRPERFLIPLAILISTSVLADAQVGVISGPANHLLSCAATASPIPQLRPEGYTELLGDIVITCTGGSTLQVGATIPTTNVIVYASPAVPITSRVLGPGTSGSNTFVSEALLIIDDAGFGSTVPTNGLVTVADNPVTGMLVTAMNSTSNLWACDGSACITNTPLAVGDAYPPITVTVHISSFAPPSLTNWATVSGGGVAGSATVGDATQVGLATCAVTGATQPGIADVQQLINQALGVYPVAFDLNIDGRVNVADVQIVLNAALGGLCAAV